jgi:V/A-type H+-transporting ATPase subunit E
MTQDLQQLLETIQREGVDKARAEADAIVTAARVQAGAIVADAERQAGEAHEAARRDAVTFEQRSSDAVRQAARDLMLGVEREVTELLTQVLVNDVKSALADPTRLALLAEEAVRAYLAGGDGAVHVLLGAKSAQVVDILRSRLAQVAGASKGVTVEVDASGSVATTGFRVRLSGGRIEHDFTATAIAESIARHVRPQLAALLRD